MNWLATGLPVRVEGGGVKHLSVFFAAMILAGGVQYKIFSQTIDGEDIGDGAETAVPETVADETDAERGYFWGEDVSAPASGGGPSLPAVFSGVIVLALSAAAIYGVVYFLKRKKSSGESPDTHLKVLARTPITIKTAAAVIAVGDRAWLTGISDNNVSLIAEITDRETVDAMLLDYSENAVNPKNARGIDFAGLLRKLGGQGGRPVSRPPEIAGVPQTSNLQRSRERLKNL
jgi:flagellar protein FliO/FliZ